MISAFPARKYKKRLSKVHFQRNRLVEQGEDAVKRSRLSGKVLISKVGNSINKKELERRQKHLSNLTFRIRLRLYMLIIIPYLKMMIVLIIHFCEISI